MQDIKNNCKCCVKSIYSYKNSKVIKMSSLCGKVWADVASKSSFFYASAVSAADQQKTEKLLHISEKAVVKYRHKRK